MRNPLRNLWGRNKRSQSSGGGECHLVAAAAPVPVGAARADAHVGPSGSVVPAQASRPIPAAGGNKIAPIARPAAAASAGTTSSRARSLDDVHLPGGSGGQRHPSVVCGQGAPAASGAARGGANGSGGHAVVEVPRSGRAPREHAPAPREHEARGRARARVLRTTIYSRGVGVLGLGEGEQFNKLDRR